MSFTIKCNECQNELVVEDGKEYLSTPTIDLLADSNIDEGDSLEVFCNNPECNRSIKIKI